MCRIREREARRSRIVWSHEQVGRQPGMRMYVPDSGARSAQKPDSTKKGNKYYDECRRYCISPFRHLPGECSQKLFRIRFRNRLLRPDHRNRGTGRHSDGGASGKGDRRKSGYDLGFRHLCRDLFRDRSQNLLRGLCLGLLQGQSVKHL